MTTHDGAWAEGTPSWADLSVDDVPAARAFYSELFGWDIADGKDEDGGYLMANVKGRPAAGIGPKMSEDPMPSVWTTYLSADDADTVAARVTAAGGTVFFPPMDVNDSGRMLVAADSQGAVFGVWQGKGHLGAGIVNEPGALCWNEVHTKTYAASQKFYADVFGYTFTEIGNAEEGFVYSTVSLSDDANAAIGGFYETQNLPEGVGSYWMTWFAVASTDDAAATAQRLGGSIVMEPTDSPFGRMAVVSGAQGETFGVIEIAQGE